MRRQPYPWDVMTADQCQARWADLATRESPIPVNSEAGKILELLAVEIRLNDPRTTKLGELDNGDRERP